MIQSNLSHSQQFYATNPQQQRKKINRSFFFDQSPSTNAQFIFDDVYKNQQEKKKCQNNPKFTYFNSLVKMKSKISPFTDLYNKVFQVPKSGEFQSVVPNTGYGSGFSSLNQSSLNNRTNRTAPSFHVQKINNRAFKIFKQNNYSHNRTSYNMPPVQDISFQIHYQNKTTKSSLSKDHGKPRLDDIMAEYRRMNKIQRQRKEKQKQSRRLSVPQKTLRLFQKKGITGGLVVNPLVSMNSTSKNASFKFNS